MTRIDTPNCSTASDRTEREALGSTCASSTCAREPPCRRAASTNTVLRTLTASERITRANTATAEMPVATAALIVWNPSELTTTTASRKLGMASSTSITRAVTTSTTPPKKPATSPSRPPITTAMKTATRALTTEERVP